MNKVIYISKGGNTKKLAEAIAKEAGIAAEQLSSQTVISNVDTLFVGGSIYAGKIDAVLREFLQKLKPEQVGQVVAFSTSAGKKTALPEIQSILLPKNIKVSGEEFYCKGSFLFANRGRPNEEDLKNAETFARKFCGGV